jgi:tetratricopeptide (TPR) repeat protein
MASRGNTVIFLFYMSKIRTAAFLLSILTFVSLKSSFAGSLWTSVDAPGQSVIQVNDQPFDKLELFAFFAAGPINSYSAHVIQQRGTDFTPDGDFISSFPIPEKQNILRNIKPRVAQTLSPDRGHAYELIRKAYDAQRNRQFASASESYQQALQLAPNSATLHLAYASNLLLSHSYPSADDQMRQSIKLWPKNAEAHAMLALSMTLQKRNSEAELESQEALRIYPQHTSAQFTLAHALTNERKYKEALPVIREAKAALPNMAALTKFLGIALLETGDTDAGIEQLSSYIKLAPDDAEGHYYFGVALRLKGSSAEAQAQFLEAVRLQPSNPQYEAAAHPDKEASTPKSSPGPKPEDGVVTGNSYTNGFFGFTYHFPPGWAVLSAEAARAMVEIGGNFISTGDPTEEDLKQAVRGESHQLLFVMENHTENQPISMKTVMISALEMQPAPTTAESYIKALGQRFSQTGKAMKTSGSPEERSIAGRVFWKQSLLIRTATGTSYSTEFVTTDKGYLLMFLLAAPDPKTLVNLEVSLDSIQFVRGSS